MKIRLKIVAWTPKVVTIRSTSVECNLEVAGSSSKIVELSVNMLEVRTREKRGIGQGGRKGG